MSENFIDIPPDFQSKFHLEIKGKNNKIKIENDRLISKININIKGDNNELFIGKNCRIGDLRIYVTGSSAIRILEATTIEQAYFMADNACSIDIGIDCMLSYGIQLRTTDSHGIYDIKTGKRINMPGNIVLGDHVWIGQGALIGKGTKVRRNSVVGAHSFLQNKAYPPSVIIAGTPARIIKEGVCWDRRQAEAVTEAEGAMDPRFAHFWKLAQDDFVASNTIGE